MRLIDADALIAEIECGLWDWETVDGITASTVLRQTISDIQNAPTVEERKTGKWIWDENGMDWGMGAWLCSKCHSRPETTWQTMRDIVPLRWSGSHYCPNCGADMRGRKDDADE